MFPPRVDDAGCDSRRCEGSNWRGVLRLIRVQEMIGRAKLVRSMRLWSYSSLSHVMAGGACPKAAWIACLLLRRLQCWISYVYLCGHSLHFLGFFFYHFPR